MKKLFYILATSSLFSCTTGSEENKPIHPIEGTWAFEFQFSNTYNSEGKLLSIKKQYEDAEDVDSRMFQDGNYRIIVRNQIMPSSLGHTYTITRDSVLSLYDDKGISYGKTPETGDFYFHVQGDTLSLFYQSEVKNGTYKTYGEKSTRQR